MTGGGSLGADTLLPCPPGGLRGAFPSGGLSVPVQMDGPGGSAAYFIAHVRDQRDGFAGG